MEFPERASSARRLRSAAKRKFDRFRRTQLGGLTGDAFYVAIWQGSAAVGDLLQVALITHYLGLTEYGRFTLVIALVTLIGEFLRLRVGYAATAFGAEAMTSDNHRAAGVFQLSFLSDLATGVLGFLVVIALIPIAGSSLTGGAGDGLLLLGALGLLASTPDMTSMAMLKLLDRFRLVAFYSAIIEIVRVVLVLVALVIFHSLEAVLAAVVIGKLARGLTNAVAAVKTFHRVSGEVRLTRPAIGSLPPEMKRRMLKMMMHTNFVGYGRLAQVQLPTLLLGGLVGARETGIYKVGMAAAASLGKLADPASAALLPRFSRLWSGGHLGDIRRLIRQTSHIFVPSMIVALAVLIPLREPILEFLGGGAAARDAGTVLILGALAQGLYGAVFWNRTLLFAAQRASAVSITVCAAGALQVLGVLVLVPPYGVTGAAAAMLGSQVIVHVALTWIALRLLRVEQSRETSAWPSLKGP